VQNLGEQIAVTPAGFSRDVLMGLLDEKGRRRAGLLADLRGAEDRLAEVDAVLAGARGFEAQAGQLVALLETKDAAPAATARLFRLALPLFRPRVVVHPANRADPDKPWLGAGPRVEVGFPPAVPEAVRRMLAAVSTSGTDEVWSFPLGRTPVPPAVYLAVAPGGGLTLHAA